MSETGKSIKTESSGCQGLGGVASVKKTTTKIRLSIFKNLIGFIQQFMNLGSISCSKEKGTPRSYTNERLSQAEMVGRQKSYQQKKGLFQAASPSLRGQEGRDLLGQIILLV